MKKLNLVYQLINRRLLLKPALSWYVESTIGVRLRREMIINNEPHVIIATHFYDKLFS